MKWVEGLSDGCDLQPHHRTDVAELPHWSCVVFFSLTKFHPEDEFFSNMPVSFLFFFFNDGSFLRLEINTSQWSPLSVTLWLTVRLCSSYFHRLTFACGAFFFSFHNWLTSMQQLGRTWRHVASAQRQHKTKRLVVSTLDQKHKRGRGWSSPQTLVTACGYTNKGKVAIFSWVSVMSVGRISQERCLIQIMPPLFFFLRIRFASRVGFLCTKSDENPKGRTIVRTYIV